MTRTPAANAALLIGALLIGACTVQRSSEAPQAAPAGNTSCCPRDTTLAEFEGVATPCTLMTELVSDDGALRACNYRMTGIEGGQAIVFCGEAGMMGSLAYAAAVAWEPRGRRLLVRDAGPDDDLRHFVLDVGAGEIQVPPEDRLRRIAGERYDQFRGWEGDSLLFQNAIAPGPVRRVAIPPR